MGIVNDPRRQLIVIERLVRHGLSGADLTILLDLFPLGSWTDEGFILRVDTLTPDQQALVIKLAEIGMMLERPGSNGTTGLWTTIILPRVHRKTPKVREIYGVVQELVKLVSGQDWTPKKVNWTTVNGKPVSGPSDKARLYQFDRQMAARGISLADQRAYLEHAVTQWYARCRGNVGKLVGYIVSPQVWSIYMEAKSKSQTRAGFTPGLIDSQKREWDARRSSKSVS